MEVGVGWGWGGCAAHLQIIKQQRRRKCFLNLHKYSLWEPGSRANSLGGGSCESFISLKYVQGMYMYVCLYVHDKHWTVSGQVQAAARTVAKFNFTDGLYMYVCMYVYEDASKTK